MDWCSCSVTEASHYSLEFNAKLGLGIVDKELLQPSDSAASLDAGSEATLWNISSTPMLCLSPAQTAKTLGCLCDGM